MIEHLRKYTGLIIFVIALLFVGLAFFGDQASMSGNSTDPVEINVDGRNFTSTEYRKTGAAAREVGLKAGLTEFVFTLGGYSFGKDDQADQRFFINRLIIKEARDEFGIHPSDEEVGAQVKTIFQGKDGAYDQALYNNFVTKGLGQYGMIEKDLIELVRDSIATKKLGAIIGGGLSADRQIALESVVSRDQQVTIQVARTALSKFQETIKPTDEELKTVWETTKEKYMTDRKIKVSYVIAKPVYPEQPKDEPKLPDAFTEEAKKASEKAAADKKAADAAAYEVVKRGVDEALIDAVDELTENLLQQEGKDFEKLVAANKWELSTTELFPRSAVPPPLAVNESSVDSPKPVGDFLFQLTKSSDPLSSFTEAIAIPEKAYLVARLDESEEARPKTFEEAREQVLADYVASKAGEALKKDTDEKAAKIREGLAAGKPFADVAKELGLEPKAHGPFKATDKLEGEADTTILFETASAVDSGKLADPVIRPDGALFVFVEKRELVKDPARAERVNQNLTGQTTQLQRMALSAWLEMKLEAKKVNLLRP